MQYFWRKEALTSSQHICSMFSLHSSHFSRTCLSLTEACSIIFKYLECFTINSELASWDGGRFNLRSSRKVSSSSASSSRIPIAYGRSMRFFSSQGNACHGTSSRVLEFWEDSSSIISRVFSIIDGIRSPRISLAFARRLGGRLTGFSNASRTAGRFRDFVVLSPSKPTGRTCRYQKTHISISLVSSSA